MKKVYYTPERYLCPAFLFGLLAVCAFTLSGCALQTESTSGSEKRQTKASPKAPSTKPPSINDIEIPKDCPSDTYVPAVDEDIQFQIPPEMIYQPRLEYPRMARTAGLQGKVLIQALVCENGDVIDARVSKSSGVVALDEAAVNQARSIKYRPAFQDGHPIKVWFSYPIDFHLDDQK